MKQVLLKNFFLFVLVLIGILYLAPIFLKPANFFADDSYFYLQVAHNFVQGHGSTFNEITKTNGYQPLWLIICIFNAYLALGSKTLLLYFSLITQTLMFVLFVYFFFKIIRLLKVKNALISLALLAVYFFSVGLWGSEAYINALMLIMFLYVLTKNIKNNTINILSMSLISAALGLAVLARLDNIFYAFIFFIYGIFLLKTKSGFKQNIILKVSLTTPFILILGSYYIFNYLNYGHLMPIAVAIKSTFPQIICVNVLRLKFVGLLVLVNSIFSLFILFWKRKKYEKEYQLIIYSLSFSVILQSVYLILFIKPLFSSWSWYFVPGVINLAFALPLYLDLILKNTNQKVSKYLIVAIIILLTFGGIARNYKRYFFENRWAIHLAQSLKQRLPKNSRIFVYDLPGMFAWYSDLAILPQDGLINNFDYQKQIVELGINNYLKMKKINYVFWTLDDKNINKNINQIDITANLSMQKAGTLNLHKNKLIMIFNKTDRNEKYYSREGSDNWALWKL